MKCVVIPAKNEGETIGGLVLESFRYGADAVVVADDSSTDATATEARRVGACVVEVSPRRRGMAGVYLAGLEKALHLGASHVVEMDAGRSHDPAQLNAFWNLLLIFDVASGRRFGPGARHRGHWKRRALSWGGTLLVNLLHRTSFLDATSGYMGYRRGALEKLLAVPLQSSGHYYQTEMRLRAVRLGLRIAEVPIVYRSSGSSLNGTSIREALKLVLGG